MAFHITCPGNCSWTNMSKVDLRKAADIAPNAMTRLRIDEKVTLTVLNKICSTLEVDIGDIMEFLPEAPVE